MDHESGFKRAAIIRVKASSITQNQQRFISIKSSPLEGGDWEGGDAS
jgi:hypothetical protein